MNNLLLESVGSNNSKNEISNNTNNENKDNKGVYGNIFRNFNNKGNASVESSVNKKMDLNFNIFECDLLAGENGILYIMIYTVGDKKNKLGR